MKQFIHIDLFAGGCGGFSAGLQAAGISFQHTYFSEIECERLQGYSDDWTKFGIYESKDGTPVTKEIPSGQRYKIIGNAVTKSVVTLLGKKLKPLLK